MKKINFIIILLTALTLCKNLTAHNGLDKGFHFTENKGQYPENVNFLCKLHLGNLFLENNKWTFDLYDPVGLSEMHDMITDKTSPNQKKTKTEVNDVDIKPYEISKHAYSMVFVGANIAPEVLSTSPLDGYKNYYFGKNQNNWASNVKSYQSVSYLNMYEGIDVEIYSQLKYLKYDFKVRKGANPSDIQILYEGIKSMKVLENGELHISLSNQVVREAKLSAYQMIDNKQVSVACNFVISNGNVISFNFPNGYNKNYDLVIDPIWVFSTLTGSTADNWGFTSTYDSQGNLYAAGISYGTGYPVTTGAYQTTFGGGSATYYDFWGDPTPNSGILHTLANNGFDISISKFSANGTTLLYSTYLGGSRNESPHSLVVDSQDNLIVLATTSSTNFPTTTGAYDATFNLGFANTQILGANYYWQGCDVVLTKFNSNGTALLASTYIGGSDNEGLNEFLPFNYSDQVRGEVVVDASDNIYVATSGFSDDFPVTTGGIINNGVGYGSQDAIIFKMNSNLTSLLWSTFYGGSLNDGAYSIRVSPVNGRVYICGGTVSTDLPMGSSPLVGTNTGTDIDGFVASFDGLDGSFVDATYLGTNSYDQAFILEVDDDGDVYVLGQSKGSYPIFNAPYSNANGSQFIHKLNPNLSTTIFSTVFGSGRATVDISPTAFLVDECENIYVAGWGGSTNVEGHVGSMPITLDAQQSSTDQSDFYFMVLERGSTSLLYGTYFGDNGTNEHVDGGTSRFDKKGVVYQSVCAACGAGGDFPTTPGVWAENNLAGNGCNMGAIKFEMNFLGIQAEAIDPGDITLCASPYIVDFNAGSNPPPHSYWDFGDLIGTSTLANPSYTYADTGSYNIMYIAIDSTTCNIADTIYFDVTLIRPEEFDAQIDVPPYNPCDGIDSLLVSMEFTGTGADSLVWDMGNGDVFSDVNSLDYYYTSQGVFTISMIAYDFICNNVDTITAEVDYTVAFTLANAVAPPDISFCGPPPYDMDFTTNSTTPHHYWDFGDTLGTSTQANPTYTYNAPSDYTIMYVAIDSSTCNIADTVYFNVDISQAEELSASFDLPSVEPCDSPDSLLVSLAFTGTGADSLSWNMGNGTVFSDVNNVDYYYTSQGNYIITMQAWDFYCNVDTTFTDTVYFNVTFSEATAEVPEDIFLCTTPLNVDFATTSSTPHHYWDFGDNLGTSTQPNVTYTYNAVGDYTVMYVAIDSSTCNIADTVFFNVSLEQAETFSATIDFVPPPPCGGDSMLVDLAFTGSGADSLIWNMGNGDVFNGNNVLYYYTEPGVYTVSLTAYDNLCNNVETISNEITFAGNAISDAEVPNVFTPNGDGQNDILKIMNIDPNAEFSMKIYNRWGRIVFESEGNGDFWDGSSRLGGEANAGVYFYEVIYRDICTDEDKLKTGYVHLMRQ